MAIRLSLLLALVFLNAPLGTPTVLPLRRFRPAPISDPLPAGGLLEVTNGLSANQIGGGEDFENYTSSFEVTRPLSPPPGSSSCVVEVMTNHLFGNNPPPFVGNYTPPTECGKSWSLISLTFSAYVKGRQFDRIVDIFFGDLQVLRTTTQEPSQSGMKWSLEADITRFQPYLQQPRVVHVGMGNVVEGIYTGVYNMSMSLTFYSGPKPRRCADEILPLGPSNGAYAAFGISHQAPSGDTLLTNLPKNILRAEIEVLASGTAADEFYWANSPSEYADNLPPEYRGGVYGGGVFRATTVSIDSIFAASILQYPVIYTGGVNPYFWRPVVGIGAFLVPTYVVDLTPFVGLLVDGGNHTVGLGLEGVIEGGWWWVNGALHLWLDEGGEATAGGLLVSEVRGCYGVEKEPQFNVDERVSWYANGIDANLSTHATHASTIRGYVVSSYGNATCTVERGYKLHNFNQVLDDMDLQKTTQTIDTYAKSTFEVEGKCVIYDHEEEFNFPMQVDIRFTLLPEGEFSEEASYSHGFNFKKETDFRGKSYEVQLNSQSGSGVYSSVVPGGGGSSQFFFSNVNGECYTRSLKQANLSFEYDRIQTSCVAFPLSDHVWGDDVEQMPSWTQLVAGH